MTLVVTANALEDLDEAWLFLAQEDLEAADRLVDEVHATAQRLLKHPELGRARPELREGIRSWTVGRYLVFYTIRRDTLIVLRVVHGRRDLDAL